MSFTDGTIEGIELKGLKKYEDERGWLMEVFRSDELKAEFVPVMGYISLTHQGVVRGPHMHREQSDLFCFAGPSDFKIYLWDYRERSSTYMIREVIDAGQTNPMAVIVPPGVVHAYKNIGTCDGLVINSPNRLFKGHLRACEIDEVRYEDISDSPFVIDD